MLPAEYRLTKDSDFAILFTEGKFVGGKFLTAKVWMIEPTKYPRRKYQKTDLKIGFLVSKKVDKRAVVRNRLKRQMREIVRLLLKDEKLKFGFMIAFIAKPEAKTAEYQELEADSMSVMKRMHILIN